MTSIIKFGTHMMGIGGVNALSARGSEMSLGWLLGLSNLGLYTRASSLPTQLQQNIYVAGSNVIFSRLSAELRESGHFHDTYLRFMRLILGLLWPMMFGIAILAQPIIFILYGEQWQQAATPLALLTIAAAITVAIGMSSEVFILRHETARQVKIESFRAVAGFALFCGGAMFSLTLAAAARIAEAAIALMLYRKPMNRLIGGPPDALRRAYIEGLLLTVAAVLPALLLMIWNDGSPQTPLPLISASIAAGGVLWVFVLFAGRHPIAQEISRLLARRS
jgi:O-antigen/teichoic acid export membrane protein